MCLMVHGSWFAVRESRLRVSGFVFRIWCLVVGILGFVLRVSSFVFRVSFSVYRLSGFIIRVFRLSCFVWKGGHLHRLALDAPLLRAEGHHIQLFRPGFDQREALRVYMKRN